MKSNTRLCKINNECYEFNMCSASQPRFLPRNSIYLGKGRILGYKNSGWTESYRMYYFYRIFYRVG